MRTSPTGLALIKRFEGFPNNGCPYRDPVGIPTRGYGRIEGITMQSPCITEAQASVELAELLAASYEPAIRALVLPLTQDQFDALVSFVYNVGVGAVAGDTGVGRALRARNWRAAGDELLRWDKAGGRTLPGLTRRRQAERELFLTAEPIAFVPYEAKLMRAPLSARTRLLLRLQARKVQLAARATPGGWRVRDRARRFKALRARALQR